MAITRQTAKRRAAKTSARSYKTRSSATARTKDGRRAEKVRVLAALYRLTRGKNTGTSSQALRKNVEEHDSLQDPPTPNHMLNIKHELQQQGLLLGGSAAWRLPDDTKAALSRKHARLDDDVSADEHAVEALLDDEDGARSTSATPRPVAKLKKRRQSTASKHAATRKRSTHAARPSPRKARYARPTSSEDEDESQGELSDDELSHNSPLPRLRSALRKRKTAAPSRKANQKGLAGKTKPDLIDMIVKYRRDVNRLEKEVQTQRDAALEADTARRGVSSGFLRMQKMYAILKGRLIIYEEVNDREVERQAMREIEHGEVDGESELSELEEEEADAPKKREHGSPAEVRVHVHTPVDNDNDAEPEPDTVEDEDQVGGLDERYFDFVNDQQVDDAELRQQFNLDAQAVINDARHSRSASKTPQQTPRQKSPAADAQSPPKQPTPIRADDVSSPTPAPAPSRSRQASIEIDELREDTPHLSDRQSQIDASQPQTPRQSESRASSDRRSVTPIGLGDVETTRRDDDDDDARGSLPTPALSSSPVKLGQHIVEHFELEPEDVQDAGPLDYSPRAEGNVVFEEEITTTKRTEVVECSPSSEDPQNVIADLRSELSECCADNERLRSDLAEVREDLMIAESDGGAHFEYLQQTLDAARAEAKQATLAKEQQERLAQTLREDLELVTQYCRSEKDRLAEEVAQNSEEVRRIGEERLATQAELRERESHLEDACRQAQAFSDMSESATAERNDLTIILAEQRDALAAAQRNVDLLSQDAAALRSECDQLVQDKSKLEFLLDQTKLELKTTTTNSTALNHRVQVLQAELDILVSRYQDCAAEATAANDALSDLRNQLAQETASKEHAVRVSEELTHELSALRLTFDSTVKAKVSAEDRLELAGRLSKTLEENLEAEKRRAMAMREECELLARHYQEETHFLRGRQNDMQRELAALKECASAADARTKKLKSEVEDMAKAYQNRSEEAAKKFSTLLKEQQELQAGLARREDEIKELEAELQSRGLEVDELQTSLHDEKAAHQATIEVEEAQRAALSEAIAKMQDAKAELKQAHHQLEELRAAAINSDTLRNALEEARRELSEARFERDAKEKVIENLRDEIKQVKSEAEDAARRSTALADALDGAKQDAKTLQTTAIQTASTLEQLQTKVRSLAEGRRLVVQGTSLEILEAISEQFVDLDHQLAASSDQLFAVATLAKATLSTFPAQYVEASIAEDAPLELVIKRIDEGVDKVLSALKATEADLDKARLEVTDTARLNDVLLKRRQKALELFRTGTEVLTENGIA